MSTLTHIDHRGQASMVDVSDKADTLRIAVAEGRITMARATYEECISGATKKGDVLGAARISGIMAAKQTSALIPLCHPLMLTKVKVDIEPDPEIIGFRVTASTQCFGPTGVEMEALTAVSVACLTLYDMLKAIDRNMQIDGVRLLEKRGGKSGDFRCDNL